MGKSVVVGQKERVGAWVAERVKRTAPWAGYEAIGLEQDGELIAGVVFDSYVKGARCSMHCAGTGRTWLNREFLFVCFDYAFRVMGCKVIINPVDADNTDSTRFTQHIGFEEVARIPDGGGDCDLVVFAMPRKTCRWLDMKRG
jgi:RimJ/RimL family protein N-acetyltransferase